MELPEDVVKYTDPDGNVCYYSTYNFTYDLDTETYQYLVLLLEQNREFKDIQAVAYSLMYYRLEVLTLGWRIMVAIIYTLTAITSFFLNVLTLLTLIRGRQTELTKYLINLSISDLMMSLFSIPFTYLDYMFSRWILPNFLCPVIKFVVTLSVFVSIATMIVIGLNRYWAIVHPLKRAGSSSFWRLVIRKNFTIGFIWLSGIAVSIPEYLLNNAITFCHKRNPNSSIELHWNCKYDSPLNIPYEIFIFLFTFLLPLLILTYLYSAIGFKLWRRRMPGNMDATRDSSALTARKKIIKMLLVIVIFFALHWLPIQTFILISTIFPEVRFLLRGTRKHYVYVSTYFVSHWISMAHSCLNPLILYFMNDDFRTDLRSLLSAWNSRNRSKMVHPLIADSSKQIALAPSYLSRALVRHKNRESTGSEGLTRQLASSLPGGAMCPRVVISFVVDNRDAELAPRCMPMITTMMTTAAATSTILGAPAEAHVNETGLAASDQVVSGYTCVPIITTAKISDRLHN